MNITLDKQIPVTQVRTKCATLFKKLPQDKVYVVVKNYNPIGAIVDIDYLNDLKKQAQAEKIDRALNFAGQEFNQLLRRKGYDPETVDKKTVNKLLFIDD